MAALLWMPNQPISRGASPQNQTAAKQRTTQTLHQAWVVLCVRTATHHSLLVTPMGWRITVFHLAGSARRMSLR